MRFQLSVRPRRAAFAKLAIRILVGGYFGFAALNAQAADPDQAASNSRVAAAFGNTVISTYPDGRTQKIWLHPDGSWDGVSRRGSALAGKWSLKDGDKVCLRQSRPPTLPVHLCVPFPANGEPGAEWMAKDFIGEPIKLSLQKGVVGAVAANGASR